MSSLLDLISGSIDSDALDELGAQIGASPQQTGNAIQAALPVLLGALHKNAASPRGAAALAGAIERDHDGSVLDNVAGFFGQPASDSDQRSVHHILGDRTAPVTNALSRASGLDGAQILQLLAQLAPLVLGALARARQSAPASSGAAASGGGGLGDLLGNARGQLHRSNSGLGGLLGGLLDANGDGSVVDDLLGKAMGGGNGGGGGLGGLLGGLLGGRRG